MPAKRVKEGGGGERGEEEGGEEGEEEEGGERREGWYVVAIGWVVAKSTTREFDLKRHAVLPARVG